MEGRFVGREIIDKPQCPFCGILFAKPGELEEQTLHEMPVGRCQCGATYACDVTGHDLGNAMIEALVLSCNGDWNQAWELLPEEDYLEKRVENYDLETHLVIHGGAYEGRQISGVLFCIKLLNSRLLSEGKKHHQDSSKEALSNEPTDEPPVGYTPLTKKEVESLVSEFNIDSLLEVAGYDKKLIRNLQRLLYSADALTRYRAADVLGKVAAIIVKKKSAPITRLLNGLFTSLNDSAASSWGYLDAIGEIIMNSPDLFAEYVPRLYQFARDRSILPEVLRVIGRICETNPTILRKNSFQFFQFLEDADPEIRGYTAILMGNLGAYEAKGDLEKLIDDPAGIEVYRKGTLEILTIGQLASEAIEKL